MGLPAPITPFGTKVIKKSADGAAIVVLVVIALPVGVVVDILTYPLPTPAWGVTSAISDALVSLWDDLWK